MKRSFGSMMSSELALNCFVLSQWIIPEITEQCKPPNSGFVMESINNTTAAILIILVLIIQQLLFLLLSQ